MVNTAVDNLEKLRQSLKLRIEIDWQVVTLYDDKTPSAVTQVAKESADKCISELDTIHDKLVRLYTTDDEIKDGSKVYCEIMADIAQIKVKLLEITPLTKPSSSGSSSGSGPSSGPSHQFRLERIKLPSFSGKFTEWEPFHDLFVSAVHGNPNLSGAEKMVYLKTALTNDALNIVSSFSTTDASYTAAWSLVKARYANPREIAFSHLRKFFDLQKVQDTASGIRKVVDLLNKTTRSLINMTIPVEHWDVILVFWTLTKLDDDTRREWLLETGTSLPVLKTLLDFLEKRADALEDSSKKSSQKSEKPSQSKSVHSASANQGEGQTKVKTCADCQKDHSLHTCEVFTKRPLKEKTDFVNKLRLCYNCLARGHTTKDCQSKFTCRLCKKRHHSLLHQESGYSSSQSKSSPSPSTSKVESEEKPEPSAQCSFGTTSSHHILLETAQVDVFDSQGKKVLIRVFVDKGSEAEFVTEDCVKKLGFSPSGRKINVTGLGGVSCGTTSGSVSLTLSSRYHSYKLKVNCEVMPKVTRGNLPQFSTKDNFSHFKGLGLADPDFFKPQSVDMILGARHATRIKLGGIVHGPPGTPSAEETEFGWLLSGPISLSKGSSSKKVTTFSHSASVDKVSSVKDSYSLDSSLNQLLTKFWETEEPETQIVPRSSQDQKCEEIFSSTTSRNHDGRFVVQLPFKSDIPPLGNSLPVALRRFFSVEKRLEANPQLRIAYQDFFKSHLDSGIVEKIPPQEVKCDSLKSFYMPYREIVKDSSTSTKVRFVFDCSAKTVNGPSLNDILYSGPKLQVDLIPLLVRFRSYPYAVSSDIVKFFNQIMVDSSHHDYQRLVYRDSPILPFTHFRMTRVTFGVTSSPYLAIRTLHKLFDDECQIPIVTQLVKEDTLVDNVLTGSFSLSDSLKIQSELISVMAKGQFQLRKWASNVPELLESIPPEDREAQLPLTISDSQELSTLGLKWDPVADNFSLVIPKIDFVTHPTKRKVLSVVARIFDPLGWLSPVTVRAKIFLQDLWKLKLEWDSPLLLPEVKKWKLIISDLEKLESFKLRRCYSTPTSIDSIPHYQLIGFSDASNLAYSAVVFVRTTNSEGNSTVTLVAAKTKVSPVRGETTPRNEFNGARLLTTLLKTIQDSLRVTVSSIVCFSDSLSVIGWLHATQTKIERKDIFIINRVRYIERALPEAEWFHVQGTRNPADCASRGISASEFLSSDFWTQGPDWVGEIPLSSHKVLQSSSVFLTCADYNLFTRIIEHSSSLLRMKRVTAWCFRFISCLKLKKKNFSLLSVSELNYSLKELIKFVQSESYSKEIKLLKATSTKTPKSLRILAPFLDSEGILRVGGRLSQAEVSFDKKFPILLPKNQHFSEVVTRHYHQANYHAGPTLLLCLLREKYWIQGGPRLVKKVTRSCVQCHRNRPTPLVQVMADLPKSRLSLSRPFENTAMDFAGPFRIAVVKGRNSKILKSYFCVFVCMAVKAVHLEFVGDLSTPSFLAALKRFVGRRGLPSNLYSDGGTNFTGAKTELEEVLLFFSSKEFEDSISNFCTARDVTFHNNPPLSPHHGGLFEAAVKSVKTHLRPIINNRSISIEEFITVLCEIERILNSRPLVPMSSDPSDVTALTPAHFLIGGSPHSFPEVDLTDVKYLDRWQITQQIAQHFWKRFHLEYLQILQSRPKWLNNLPNIEPGVLVLVKESDAAFSSHKWNLARVTQVFPGSDGKVRVVEIMNTSGDLFRRPIVKISPLPIE